MKWTAHIVILASILQVYSTSAQLLWPNFFSGTLGRSSAQRQAPIMNIPIPSFNNKKDDESTGAGSLSISDVIGKERIINIFAGFTRDIDAISKRLDDPEQNTTVLAPLNSALQKLPRKPWENPKDYDEMGAEAYEEQSGEDRATSNLRHFVEAHSIPVSPWKEGEKTNSLRGEKVWWEEKDGKRMIQPGNIEVASTANKVSNGEVWVLKGCMNYE